MYVCVSGCICVYVCQSVSVHMSMQAFVCVLEEQERRKLVLRVYHSPSALGINFI